MCMPDSSCIPPEYIGHTVALAGSIWLGCEADRTLALIHTYGIAADDLDPDWANNPHRQCTHDYAEDKT